MNRPPLAVDTLDRQARIARLVQDHHSAAVRVSQRRYRRRRTLELVVGLGPLLGAAAMFGWLLGH